MSVVERRRHILARLNREGQVSVAELSRELGVSRMTVHRDLRRLEEEGAVRRVRGGAVLQRAAAEEQEGCAMCGGRVRRRTVFLLQDEQGSLLRACCPHCGLMLLQGPGPFVSALAAEFLYGRMVNARSAAFLVDSQVTLCCTPSILCFETEADARRFQKGFGGKVMSLEAARQYLQHQMTLATP
ncbi:MAG: DeoR family transcriptional regulator [Caldilineae bacterium]|nr:MAG: DeoR family transcriptional regulator [Caldilineae bacterium]